MRDDAGVIAIIVALSISTFLLGVAALAVDLGTAYIRKAELKSVAEKVALAGAQYLPTVTDGLAAAVGALGTGAGGGTGLCHDDNLAGVCDAPAGWASDGNPDNGEITFYADEGQKGDLADQNGDGKINVLDKVTGATDAVGIHVVLPPSKVPFGFASALGFNSASVQETATARIGTPLGSGILPFSLGPADLSSGEFCVKDPAVTSDPNPVRNGTAGAFLAVTDPLNSEVPITGGTITAHVGFIPWGSNDARVQFHIWDGVNDRITTSTDTGLGIFQVDIPVGTAADQIVVWATGRTIVFPQNFRTNAWTLTYAGAAPTKPDPCTLPTAARGFLKIARSTGGANTLEPNIRQSPEVKLYPSGGLVGTVGQLLNCVSDTLSSPATTCLSGVLGTPFSQNMTNGMFNSGPVNGSTKPGRLDGDCGAGESSVRGHDVDAMQLFGGASPLVDTGHGSAAELKNLIESGAAPTANDQGWITAQALKCPRLAVMPVLDPNPVSGITGQKITKLEYVWIDDTDSGRRGLNFNGSRLASFQGYVIDPKLLPNVVAGSPIVGPYLGADMPKEALLIPDFT